MRYISFHFMLDTSSAVLRILILFLDAFTAVFITRKPRKLCQNKYTTFYCTICNISVFYSMDGLFDHKKFDPTTQKL